MLLAVLGIGSGAGAQAASASSLRYFGYFAARLTAASGNHLPEVTGRSNLNWIQISDPDRYASEVLDSCSPHGCIVSTGNEFFRNCDSTHDPDCELYPDYAARWARFAAAVRSRISKVGAFYLLDEPQWRGATPAQLETAAQTIKQTFPGVPVMMVEAGPQVSSSLQVPAAVDWVGFDWYCRPFTDVQRTLATLSTRISPQQSLFLVMESAPLQACGGAKGHATDADIAALQYQYLRLANSNPRVIGLLAFGFWTSGYGSAQLPLTVAAHRYIWSQIPHATGTPPPSGPPSQPPPSQPPPSQPPPPAPGPRAHPRGVRVRIVDTRLLVPRRGPLRIRLRCPRPSASRCAGRLSLRLLAHKRERRSIGTRRFAVKPGRIGVVKIKVGPRLRGSLLRSARSKHNGRVRVSAATAAGRSSKVLSLRLERRHHAVRRRRGRR